MHSSSVVRAAAVVALGAVLMAGAARAGMPQGRPARPFAARTIDVARRIDVNQLNMFVSNEGSFAYDLSNAANAGGEGLFYPRGTAKNAVFAAGPWISAVVDTTLFVTVAEYSDEYGPGPIVAGSATGSNPAGSSAPHTDPNYIVYKVVRWSGDPADTSHVVRSATAMEADGTADPLVHHSWSEYMKGAVPYGAPWKTWRLPKAGSTTDSVDVPGPDVLGDMMCWSVYNDADPSLHTNEAGRRLPMGLEIQQTTFAFNRQGALGNTVFVRYKIYNRGLRPLRQMFFSQWVDPDLGGYTDDYVGCDTLPDRFGKPRSLGYCYNSTAVDQIYGANPPAVGFDFLQGPKDSLGTILPMTSFDKYINGTDPSTAVATRNYQLGLNGDGTTVLDPWNTPTRYNDAGNPQLPPNTTGNWVDSNPADRRMMLSSGPFQMLPGDSQVVVVGLVVGQCGDNLAAIKAMDYDDDFVQGAFDEGFNVPAPPPLPKVTVAQYHDQITLTWDSASRFNYHEPGYTFEGYNVYQGESVAGPWIRLATFDEIDHIRGITDVEFNSDACDTLPTVVAFGTDSGIRYSYSTTTDAITHQTLRDATQYYYAVTAYGYDPLGLPKVLEDPQAVVRVMPQRPPAGTDLTTASVLPVTKLQKDPSKPPTTDAVMVDLINPAQVTGHVYKVSFQPLSPIYSGQVAGDTATVLYAWSLTDSTTGTVLTSGQLNRRGGTDYPVVDGLRVAEVGSYFPRLADVEYVSAGTDPPAYQGNPNWLLNFFGGGAGSEADFGALNTTLDPSVQPDSFTTVEIRLGVTQRCYRYFRLEKASDGSAPGADRGYPYGGYFTCPFQVWDVTHNRQLDAVFTERMVTADDGTYLASGAQPASQDSTWDPGIDGDPGGVSDREYLAVLSTPYSDTPKPAFMVNHLPLDGMPFTWFLGADLSSPTAVPDPGDKIVYTWANPATSNDVFVFDTKKMVTNNSALAKSRLAAVRVVPNPYYSHSLYEINQFNHIVRFINMPEQCTVRIFNLAGQLVRTLHKTDATSSVLEWNLLTDNQLPVGSGVYVYQLDAGASGSTIGRIAVFVEKERLNNF